MKISWFKYSLIVYLVGCIVCNAYAQPTFSKMLDIGEDDKYNASGKIAVLDDTFFMHSLSFCNSNSSQYQECVKLSKFDIKGDIINTKIFDTLTNINGCSQCLTIYNGEILLSANHKNDDFSNIFLYRLSADLEIQQIYTYPVVDSNSQTVNRGIVNIDSTLYIYTRVYNYVEEIMKMRIIKLDDKFKEVWRHSYNIDSADLTMLNLINAYNGKLAFIVGYHKSGAGIDVEKGFTIYTIDTSGAIINSFSQVSNKGNYLHNLTVSYDEYYYFHTVDHPIIENDYEYDRINKFSPDLDSLIWSITIPKNSGIDLRSSYNPQEILELKNGDILISGLVDDDKIFKETYYINNWRNGFLLRLSPQGEVVWLRVFKVPNTVLPTDEFGHFMNGTLVELIELDNNQILLLGGIGATSQQILELNLTNQEIMYLWLMLVNEDGCLDQYPCQEVIILDDPSPVMDPWFPVGTKWTYNYYPETSDPEEVIHSYIDFYVTGTYWQNEELVYHIENNRGLPNIKMKQDGQKTWFWHPEKKLWQLTYDFYAQFSYPVQWEEDKTLEAELYKPMYATSSDYFGTRNAQDLQYVRIIDEEDTLVNKTILTTMGGYSGGITFDNHQLIGEIRCFTHDTFFYNFTSGWPHIPCDTIYSNQPDAVINAPTDIPIQVYPNPTNHRLFVQLEGYRDVRYKIVDIAGVVQQEGRLEEFIEVDNLKSGSFVIQFFTEKTFLGARKFFKFE